MEEGQSEKTEIHDNSIQDILARPPKRIIYFGIGLLFCIAIIVFSCFCFLSVPEIVEGNAVIIQNNDSSITDRYEVAIQFPAQYAGKISPKQPVIIRLDSYPSSEYGFLQLVTSEHDVLTSIGNGSTYEMRIMTSEPLVSDKKIILKYIKNMRGTADIIIGKRRLLTFDIFKIRHSEN